MNKESDGNSSSTFLNEDDSHSEKVRHIIEQKPAFIVRWGNTLLLVVLLILLLIIIGYAGFTSGLTFR